MAAEPGYSNELAYGDATTAAATVTWTDIAEVQSFSFPNLEVTDIDVSVQADRYRQFIPGMIDAGEVTAEIVFDETEYNTLYGTLLGTQRGYRVTTFGGATVEFDGYIKSLGNEVPQDDKLMTTATIKVTGQPTFAVAP